MISDHLKKIVSLCGGKQIQHTDQATQLDRIIQSSQKQTLKIFIC